MYFNVALHLNIFLLPVSSVIVDVLFGRPHMEMFLADLRKTREHLKGQPEEMAKVENTVFHFLVVGFVQ